MVKYPPATAEDARRSLGVRNGNPLQYSCLESPWTEKLLDKPRTPGTSSEESSQGVFCYVNEVAFEKHLRMVAVICVLLSHSVLSDS